MIRAKYIGFLLMLLICSMRKTFAHSPNGLVIANDRLILTIDLRSSSGEVDSILKVAGITAKASNIKKNEFEAINNDGWQQASKQGEVVKFERLLTDVNYNPRDRPFRITTEIPSI